MREHTQYEEILLHYGDRNIAMHIADERQPSYRELGLIPVEVNASDTRNKADKSAKAGMGGKLSNAIKELANNTALGLTEDGHRKRVCCALMRLPHISASPCQPHLCSRSLAT